MWIRVKWKKCCRKKLFNFNIDIKSEILKNILINKIEESEINKNPSISNGNFFLFKNLMKKVINFQMNNSLKSIKIMNIIKWF